MKFYPKSFIQNYIILNNQLSLESNVDKQR